MVVGDMSGFVANAITPISCMVISPRLLFRMVHDNRWRRELTCTTAILDFAFQFSTDEFTVRLIKWLGSLRISILHSELRKEVPRHSKPDRTHGDKNEADACRSPRAIPDETE